MAPPAGSYSAGSGTPLVLLHGIGATWRAWNPVLPFLEAHHAVFAPTLPGHSGASRLAPDVVPTVGALVDGIARQLDELGIERAHLAGNSLGGWIALELARRGRARSVVLFGPAGAWISARRLAGLLAAMRVSSRMLRALAPHADAIAQRRFMRQLLLRAQVAHPDRVDPAELAAAIRAAADSPVVAPLLRTVARHPFEYLLEDSRCPIRLVWAERDQILPFAHYGWPLQERLPGAELVRLPGVGHVPMSDDPQKVAHLILEVTAAADAKAERT
jgi:pimeloyl-ACP methyl ester carboxylesterase